MKKITFTALISIVAFHLYASNYYVTKTGNVPSGTNPSNVMSSVYDIAGRYYSLGDSILIEAGQTFQGSIYLSQSGSSDQPIVISTYGQGKATIVGSASDKAVIGGYNVGGWVFENLELTGSAPNGVNFYVDNLMKNPDIKFTNLDIHGSFSGEVLTIGAWDSSYLSGYSNIEIDMCKFHDAPKGIFIYDMAGTGTFSYSYNNVKITNSEVYNIQSSGILLCGVGKGLVDYCYVHDCTGSGGVATWTYASANVVIQNSIFANYVTSGNDGGGLDLDGGSVNCTVQYCYTYNNYGPAAMVCDYPGSRPTTGNTVRYCISENDCRKPQSVGGGEQNSYSFVNWGAGINNSYIYNNTVYLTPLAGATRKLGAYGCIRLDGYAQGPVQGCKVVNNIAYLYGSGLYNVINDVSDTSVVAYWNNAFYNSNTPMYYDGGTTYSSMDQWRASKSGQEKKLDGFSGFEGDLKLLSPGKAGVAQIPSTMKSIVAYSLQSNSPCIGKGVDVKKYFGLDPGAFDFIGNSNLNGGLYDMGACAYNPGDILEIDQRPESTKLLVYPNPSKGLVFVKVENPEQFNSVIICDMFGHQLKQISYFSVDHPIDISELPTGIYNLCFESRGCVVISKKIMKI
jgi:Secretion system C-terminal sorting domain/Right handed beta helix region